jgi:hypothetical protein
MTTNRSPFLGLIALPLLFIPSSRSCREISGQRFNDERVKDEGSCLVIEHCLFLEVNAALTTHGGAICLWVSDSVGNRLAWSTFIACYTGPVPFSDCYGGGVAILVGEVSIFGCCGCDCHSEYGQFVYVEAGRSCSFSEVSALRCSPDGKSGAENGAFDFYNDVSPVIRNMNCTACYCETHCSAIGLWGISVSPDCRFFTILKDTGLGSVYSHRPNFLLSSGNFVENSHADGIVRCNEHLISLSHCHFKGNSGPLFFSESGGKFSVSNCHLGSALPGGIPYSLTTNNNFDANAATLPLCHLSTIYCEKAVNCATFTFAPSSFWSPSTGYDATRSIGPSTFISPSDLSLFAKTGGFECHPVRMIPPTIPRIEHHDD